MRRRALAALVALGAPMLLGGCTLAGTVVVRSPALVEVDLTYTPDASAELVRHGVQGCLLDSTTIATLDFTRELDPAGQSVCRIRGHARVDDLQRYFGVLRQVGDFVQVEFYPAGRVPDDVAEYTLRRFDGLDVTVTFPGEVAEHVGGRVSGRSIQFADLTELVANRGLSASGLARPTADGPQAPWAAVAAGAGGLLAGALAGAWWGVRAGRRRAATAGEAPPDPPPGPDAADEDWSHT